MVTELQRRFSRSRVLRRGMLEAIEEDIGSVNGYRQMWYNAFAFTFKNLPEGQIKVLLYQFLQCGDITPSERAEILLLLRLSTTALTRRQRRQIAQHMDI